MGITLYITDVILCANDKFTKTHECNRPCVEGGKTKTCRYKFDVQWYLTMSKACYNCPFDQTDCFRGDCVPGKFG